MMAGYPWLELADLAFDVRERLAAAGPRGLRVTISECVVPIASPHPIEIFAGTLARSRPDPDVSSPLAALKHAFRDDPFDVFRDPHTSRVWPLVKRFLAWVFFKEGRA